MSHRYKVGQIVEATVAGRGSDMSHEIVRLMPEDVSGVPQYRVRGTATGLQRLIREDDIGRREPPAAHSPAHAMRQARIRQAAARALARVESSQPAPPPDIAPAQDEREPSPRGADAHVSALEAGALRRALRQLNLARDPEKLEAAAETLRRLDAANPALAALQERAQQLRRSSSEQQATDAD